MGFFDDVWSAVQAPVTSTISSVQSALRGDLVGSLKAQTSGLGATLKPVGTYTSELGKGFLNAGRGAYSGLSSLSKGDLKGTGQGVARVAVSGTNIAHAENTVGMGSPTGYGAISRGDTSPDAYRRAAITTAALATAGAGASGASGGILTGGSSASYAPALSALAAGDYKGAATGLVGGNLGIEVPSELKDGYNSISPYLPALAAGSTPESQSRGLAGLVGPTGVASPSGFSALPLLLIAGGAGLYFYMRRRG